VINLPTSSAHLPSKQRVSTKQVARICPASSVHLPSKQRASTKQAARIYQASSTYLPSVHLPVNYNLLVKLNDEEFLRRGRKKL